MQTKPKPARKPVSDQRFTRFYHIGSSLGTTMERGFTMQYTSRLPGLDYYDRRRPRREAQ